MSHTLRSILSLFLLSTLSWGQAQAYDEAIQARHDSILRLITGAPSQHPSAQAQTIKPITAFGAKAGGIKNCKPAFDRAMRAASRQPQGLHIVVPAGDWFVKGPIHLVSNVTLELQEGARLLFSPNAEDYPMVRTSWEGSFCQNYSPMIYGFQLQNVAIIGRGTIDGNCSATFPLWRNEQKSDQQQLREQDHTEVSIDQRQYGPEHQLRPHLIQLFGCEDVTLSGLFITNSPFWCVHLLHCQNVICRGLRYDAKLVNNDGIDPEMTRNLLIEEIDFDNGDDNVAIKAGRDNDGWGDNLAIAPQGLEELYRPQPTENIIIRNCRFKGLHGLVIGSEMSAGVRNVFVEDCQSRGYNKRALYVKTNPNRGGFVHDIYFQNCQFDEVEDLFYITSMYAGEGADDNHFTDVHDIHIDRVSARKVRNAAIVLQGTEAKPLKNISFHDINVQEAKIGFSSMHAPGVTLSNCNLGGTVNSAPSQASQADKVFEVK